ncbi:Detected protein of unknown function [Hibiscus syriacus]|uniref:Uncharacterized protein n=1 Tax=Hibiscus syriacus TaxID=106335 RepID=A0A6A2WJI8_HIBSY|nr:Detected protein of unknown function [Hibiscus syriacus]
MNGTLLFSNFEFQTRDQDKNAIIRMLMSKNYQQQSLHIISVVGMGGIGKTTLAQLAYNDQELNSRRLQKIHRLIQRKKFLLVWMSVDGRLHKVGITETLSQVRSNGKQGLDHHTEGKCCEHHGEHIHVPVRATVRGGMLVVVWSGEDPVMIAKSVLDSELSELEEVEKGIFPPLLLSYYDLSSTLRQCFSYCALFLKDTVIDKLIKLWMAQGFLKGMVHKEMEIIGQECFDDLAMRSFFQDFQKDENNNNIMKCKMHDIVHDFAQFLTKTDFFMLGMEAVKQSTKTESYNGNYFRHLVIELEKESPFPSRIYNVRKLCSLLIKSYNKNSSIGRALPKLFDQLICIRTLDLSWCLTKEIPKEIGNLTNLRYLKLGNNYALLELPETLCNLYNLQIFDFTRCRSLLKLPSGIRKLLNLRHLDNWETFGLRSMPKGMQRLTCHRTLEEVVVSNGSDGNKAFTLGDLSNLSYFRGDLKIRGLGNAADVTGEKKSKTSYQEGPWWFDTKL